MKKKVVVQLPPVAKEAPLTTRYALELEALDSVSYTHLTLPTICSV